MTVRFKAHQLKEPLQVGQLLAEKGVDSLTGITTWLKKSQIDSLRSHRRVLLSTLRYVRTHAIQTTPKEWSAFAESITTMPLAWDEAKNGRYRFRVPGKEALSPRAFTLFLKASLDQLPPGWHASVQTRQHYRYAIKSLPEGFKSFVTNPAENAEKIPASLGQSMRALIGQKFPSPHSSFIETLASGLASSIAPNYWPKQQPTLSTNDKWVQAAFALARHGGNSVLVNGIHDSAWCDPKKSLLADAGLALSFFEIIQRLPMPLGRPTWMPMAFAKMLAKEKMPSFIERGWKAVNFTEEERFSLLMNLAKDYPATNFPSPLGELLKFDWTIPVEDRKALARKEYAAFGEDQTNTTVNTMLDNAREWIGLLVPEMKTLLDLWGGGSAGPAQEILQLEQFLIPAETGSIELPQEFDESREMRDLLTK